MRTTSSRLRAMDQANRILATLAHAISSTNATAPSNTSTYFRVDGPTSSTDTGNIHVETLVQVRKIGLQPGAIGFHFRACLIQRHTGAKPCVDEFGAVVQLLRILSGAHVERNQMPGSFDRIPHIAGRRKGRRPHADDRVDLCSSSIVCPRAFELSPKRSVASLWLSTAMILSGGVHPAERQAHSIDRQNPQCACHQCSPGLALPMRLSCGFKRADGIEGSESAFHCRMLVRQAGVKLGRKSPMAGFRSPASPIRSGSRNGRARRRTASAR